MPSFLLSDRPDTRSFPTNRGYFALGLLFMAFALYGSLLPFDLRFISMESAWSQYQTAVLTAPSRISRTDLLANLLLFVPVGFTLAGALLVDRGRRSGLLRATVAILPISLAFSVLAEFLQTFASRRVPSNADIAAQTAGCFVGIVVWAIAGSGLTRWVRETSSAAPPDRLSRALTGFAVGWIFVNLAPFDISVDVGDLARRLRSGKIAIVPFTSAGSLSVRGAWDALAEVVSAVPLGAFGFVGWSGRRRSSRAMAFGAGAAIVAVVEFAQVFISSHSASTTDLIFAWMGVGLGVLIGERLLSTAGATHPAPSPTSLSATALWAIAGWCFVLCAYHWVPYDFAIDHEVIKRKISGISIIPFAGYQSGSDLNALSNLLAKLALSAPLGVGAAFAFRVRSRSMEMSDIASIAVAGLIFAVIEMGQFFLAERVPDPTDVLIGMAGTYAGLLLGRWLRPDGRAPAGEGSPQGQEPSF